MVYDIFCRYTAFEESEEGSYMPARKVKVGEKTEGTQNFIKKRKNKFLVILSFDVPIVYIFISVLY